MRPASIRKFDLFYLGSLALGVVNFFFGFDMMKAQAAAQLAANPSLAGLDAGTIMIVSFVIGLAINLGLWALISRLRIELVKWILVLFVLWGLVSLPALVSNGITLIVALSLLTYALQIAAIVYLFKPDAKAWFAEKRGS